MTTATNHYPSPRPVPPKDGPLHVDFVSLSEYGVTGRLGLTIAPGKIDPNRGWDRNLREDLAALKDRYRTDRLVSLMEEFEYGMLKIPALLDEVKEAGIATNWFPIRDVGAPPVEEMDAFGELVDAIVQGLRAGETIIVHCRGGIGRSGLLAASCLVALGTEAARAIDKVREARPGAVETWSQEEWVRLFAERPAPDRDPEPNATPTRGAKGTPKRDAGSADVPAVETVKACLLLGAIGDALGADVEFLDSESIEDSYGNEPPRELTDACDRGRFTDDTQMTLFTAEAVIRWRQCVNSAAHANAHANENDELQTIMRRSLLRWYETQSFRRARSSGGRGWLVDEPGLQASRAPGATCMDSLQTLGAKPKLVPTVKQPENDSKGCGAVMRVAPIGLAMASAEEAFIAARDAGVLTHGHPSGYLSGAYFAALIWSVSRAKPLATAMEIADALLDREAQNGEMVTILERTRKLAALGIPSVSTIERLGRGWTGEEALAIALLCVLTHDADQAGGVERTLWRAAAHSGDSDSTAAIAGNLLGALYGEAAIPVRWLAKLDSRHVVEQVAVDLHAATGGKLLDMTRYPAN